MNTVSKYIIIVLFVTSVLLGINIIILNIQNDDLKERNTRLSEMVALRDAAISEIDKNIKSLQQQAIEAEQICNERIQARKDVVDFLHINPPNFAQSSKGVSTPPAFYTGVIDDKKSNFAIDNINNYWGMFTTLASDSKK